MNHTLYPPSLVPSVGIPGAITFVKNENFPIPTPVSPNAVYIHDLMSSIILSIRLSRKATSELTRLSLNDDLSDMSKVLERSKEVERYLVENFPLVVFSPDPDGSEAYGSRFQKHPWGYRHNEVLGEDLETRKTRKQFIFVNIAILDELNAMEKAKIGNYYEEDYLPSHYPLVEDGLAFERALFGGQFILAFDNPVKHWRNVGAIGFTGPLKSFYLSMDENTHPLWHLFRRFDIDFISPQVRTLSNESRYPLTVIALNFYKRAQPSDTISPLPSVASSNVQPVMLGDIPTSSGGSHSEV
ncbi:hypothetical protein VNI00_000741 [Paramarasmius palmivorus]|uniref:Uncharacterized protein n=1 Tax=Paramarasmius palmivorus TaxID=297713 RepID=A0AAW0E659_9AGAR